MLPLPEFYDPARVADVYVERAALVTATADAYGREHDVRPSAADTFKIAAFGIDCQSGFSTPGASLFVPGAVEDTRRTIEWLYANIGKITALFFSMDTHELFQIFHPAWWKGADGRPPPPFTTIT